MAHLDEFPPLGSATLLKKRPGASKTFLTQEVQYEEENGRRRERRRNKIPVLWQWIEPNLETVTNIQVEGEKMTEENKISPPLRDIGGTAQKRTSVLFNRFFLLGEESAPSPPLCMSRKTTKKRKGKEYTTGVLRLRGGAGPEEEQFPEDFFPLQPSPSLPQPVKVIVRRLHQTYNTSDQEHFFRQVRNQCEAEGVEVPPFNLKTLVKTLGLPLEVQETCTTGDCGPIAAVKQLRLVRDQNDEERRIINLEINDRHTELRTYIKTKMQASSDPWIVDYKRNYIDLDHIASILPGGTKWPSYHDLWEAMGRPNIYVEEPFWTALAKILERDVHVITMSSSPYKPFHTFSGLRYEGNKQQDKKQPLFIGYNHYSRHYVSLKPFQFAQPSMTTIVKAYFSLEKRKEDQMQERLLAEVEIARGAQEEER